MGKDWYYCVAVSRAGVEKRLATRLNNTFAKADMDAVGFLALCPEKDVLLQHQGLWVKERKPMIPGYIMIRSTADAPVVRTLLMDAHSGGSLLRYGDGSCALYGRDLAYAQWIFSYEGVIGISTVRLVEGNAVEVVSGPLKSMHGIVTKVEKKGRKVWVDFPMMQQVIKVSIGAEFLKSDENP